jgi:hypothetical protein
VGRPVLEVKTKEEKTGSVSSAEWQGVEEKGSYISNTVMSVLYYFVGERGKPS